MGFLGRHSPPDAQADVHALEEQLQHVGVDYFSLGTVTPDCKDETYSLIHAVLQKNSKSFATVTVTRDGERHVESCRKAAAIIKRLSTMDKDGFKNLQFAALANVPPRSPFLPAAYHEGAPGLNIGCQFVGLLHDAFEGQRTSETAAQSLKECLTAHLVPIDSLARDLTEQAGIAYYGIDASVAPAPGERNSIASAIEKVLHEPFGSPGTREICAMITKILKSLPVKLCGYSGLMLPVLEDSGLAERNAEGRFSIHDLLDYSSVCGTGLDTIPLSGDVSESDLTSLIEETAQLSCKLQKPLSVRAMPIPGLHPGDRTRFTFEYFANTTVMSL